MTTSSTADTTDKERANLATTADITTQEPTTKTHKPIITEAGAEQGTQHQKDTETEAQPHTETTTTETQSQPEEITTNTIEDEPQWEENTRNIDNTDTTEHRKEHTDQTTTIEKETDPGADPPAKMQQTPTTLIWRQIPNKTTLEIGNMEQHPPPTPTPENRKTKNPS